uniref:SLAM family member 7-like isoform X1 n=1 Tax=Phascolarctos cinereus TaxID=38626 RepID=A0A6P5JLQ7_PHACI|nr:SLAM family member 7-like isoform X1 [Phascolarctos cinereus]
MTKYHLWFLLFCLLTEPRASRENYAPVMVTGILEESAILPAEIPSGHKLENINWASRTPVALVQPEGQSFKVITTHQNYRGRLNVPPNTYNLKISPLKMEDAGFYRADINLQNSATSTITITKNYTLHVYRRLAPPKITWNTVASENNICNITLMCFMEEGREAVKYQWTPLGEQAVESNGKSRLFIFQRPEDAPINYTCTAMNPVSNNSQSKLVQYLCAGALVTFDPRWYTLLSVLEMVIVIILTGMGFYLWHKKKQGVTHGRHNQREYVWPVNMNKEPRASRENYAPVMVTGILEESAILPAEIPSGHKLENINWASRTPVALVQPEGQSFKVITTHQNYRGRLNVPPNTYNLKISPLKMEDAGFYRADINLQNSATSTITITKNYTLHVYRRLAPPKITWNTVASENNTCNITLTCFMEEGREAVKYQWTPLGEQAVESNGKSRLFIFQRPERCSHKLHLHSHEPCQQQFSIQTCSISLCRNANVFQVTLVYTGASPGISPVSWDIVLSTTQEKKRLKILIHLLPNFLGPLPMIL